MVQGKRSKAAVKPQSEVRADHLSDLLTFYYPMHFRIGMDLETVMGQGRVSRKQAAILWLIHSRADEEGWVRRKVIETRLSTWFEVSNSSISNLLRELTRAPLELVQQVENPNSGREKLVRLTPQGRRFVDGMIDQSVEYLRHHLGHLDDNQLAWGIQFFKLAFNRLRQDDGAAASTSLQAIPDKT